MKLKHLILASLLFTCFLSCKKEIEVEQDSRDLKLPSTQASNPNNPYSLANMRKAFATLLVGDIQLLNNNKAGYAKGKVMFSEKAQRLSINRTMSASEGAAIADNGLNATHYYIKFIPRNDQDYTKLKADSNLVIYPFPLDTEVTAYSGSYRDPSVPAGVPTYQYAAIPVGYVLPDVPFQKLEDLYLPDENKNTMVTARAAGGSSFSVSARALADQAICDIINDPQPEYDQMMPVEDCDTGGGGGYAPGDPYRNGDDWRPNGRITVYDEVKGEIIGVEGMKIRARRWFTTYVGFTDANGYYAVDGWYTRPANYWLDFERYEFSVNDHSGGPREISGPKIEAAWNVQFDGYDKFCSTIFRASYHYYYKDRLGLNSPPENGFWHTQMKLGAFNEERIGSNGDTSPIRHTFGIGLMIHIYNPQRRIDETYATTIHELGHTVHLNLTGGFWADDNVCESWSRGVQWVLTKMVYPNYKGGPYVAPNYTNVVMDMIDSESDAASLGKVAPEDQVSGYSIVEIQNSLIGVHSAYEWKNKLKNNYENSTEHHLDALFSAWGL